MKRIQVVKILFIASLFLILCMVPAVKADAATATAVSFGTIDYEKQTMQVFYNNNTIVYYSTDNSNWSEVEGAYDSTSGAYVMDISWVSTTSDVTLYFKGDVLKTVKTIILPAQNTSFGVTYDKVEGTFTFESAEESDVFEWRKETDYNWNTVDMEEDSTTYTKFLKQIEIFKVLGAKIIIRLPEVNGTGVDNVGLRSSKEITITIPARATAPTIKVNSSKLTVNTSTSMEYYDSSTNLWIECTGVMSLEDIAPKVLYANGATATTLKIRKAATTSSPYSKTTYLTIPAQTAAPVIGGNDSDVSYYYQNAKLMLTFNKATTTNVYEYTIVKSGYELTLSTASWKSVKTATAVAISSSTAPEGCTIYIRKKGTDGDSTDASEIVLSSAMSSFTVDY